MRALVFIFLLFSLQLVAGEARLDSIRSLMEGKDDDEKVEFLESALQDAIRLSSREQEKWVYEELIRIWEKKEDHGKTLLYWELLRSLKDSILHAENRRTMAELKKTFETEKKDQELSLLQKEKSIQELEKKTADDELTRKNLMKYGSMSGLGLLLFIALFFLKTSSEQKRKNVLLQVKNKELEIQSNILEQKNTLIHDSIEYAGIIQQTLFPTQEQLQKDLGNLKFTMKPGQLIANHACALEHFHNAIVFFFVQSHLHGVSGSLHALRIYHELRNHCIVNYTFEAERVRGFIRTKPASQFDIVTLYKTPGTSGVSVVGDEGLAGKILT